MKYYVFQTIGDVEPKVYGPFKTSEERDCKAKKLRIDDPEKKNGIFPLDINECGVIYTCSYSGGFFETI